MAEPENEADKALPTETQDFVDRYGSHMEALSQVVAGQGVASPAASYKSFDGRQSSTISNYPLPTAPCDGFSGAPAGQFGAPKTDGLETLLDEETAGERNGAKISKWLAQLSYLEAYRKALAARRSTPLTYRRAWQAHLTFYDQANSAVARLLAQQKVGVGAQSIPDVREGVRDDNA